MGLDKQEDELLEKLEEKGLERRIRHIQFDEPRDIEYDGKEYRNTMGITAVMLVDGNINEQIMNEFIDLPNTPEYVSSLGNFMMSFKSCGNGKINEDESGSKGFGIAICSAREPEYHKQLGRIIATGRAMKDSNLK